MQFYRKGRGFIDNINIETLRLALQYGIIDPMYVQVQIEMKDKEDIIALHPYSIWQSVDGKWRTYLPDDTKPNKRRLVKRGTKEEIHDIIVSDYRQKEKEEELANRVTLRRLFPEWLKYKWAQTDASSYIKRLSADWKKYYNDDTFISDTPIEEFNKNNLSRWAHEKIKAEKLDKKRYYNMSIIVRQILDYAVDEGILEVNVFRKVRINTKLFRRKKKPAAVTQVFMTDEKPKLVAYLMERFNGKPSYTAPLAVMLAFETGLRIAELVGLRSSDICDNYLEVERQEVRRFEFVDEYTMKFCGFELVDYVKSDDGYREVYLTTRAREIIKLVMNANINNGEQCEDFLFVYRGKRMTHYAIQSMLIKCCKKVGISNKTMHKIRKTYISDLIDGGVSLDEVRRQAGHADEKTTLACYHFNRKTSAQTENQIEAALDPEKGNQR